MKKSVKPLPAEGKQNRLLVPAGADGLKFTLERMNKMIVEGSSDSLVVDTARVVAAAALDVASQLGRCIENRDLVALQGLHAWLHSQFVYMGDPVGVELLQMPNRMLRALQTPELILRPIWEPIADAMAAPHQRASLKPPRPKITGASNEAVVISLAMAGALGMRDLTMMLGTQKKANPFHYVFGKVKLGDFEIDFDILHAKFYTRYSFERFAEVPVVFES